MMYDFLLCCYDIICPLWKYQSFCLLWLHWLSVMWFYGEWVIHHSSVHLCKCVFSQFSPMDKTVLFHLVTLAKKKEKEKKYRLCTGTHWHFREIGELENHLWNGWRTKGKGDCWKKTACELLRYKQVNELSLSSQIVSSSLSLARFSERWAGTAVLC